MIDPVVNLDSGGAGTGLLTPPREPIRPRRPRRRRDAGGGPPPPPEDPGDGDDGGDGRDEEGDGENDRTRPGDALPLAASAVGLGLALVASGTLFLVFASAFLVLRSHAVDWPPPGFPGAPRGLWLSSALLAASSAALALAARAVKREPGARGRVAARRRVVAALVLGVGFVVAQTLVWRELFLAGVVASTHVYATGFYTLTALHALHVIGGMVALGSFLWRARSDAARVWKRPFRLVSVYWHFMGGVWVVLFVVLSLAD